MQESRKYRLAVIARTQGLEYDDRIRKECISLSKIADIKIFVNFTGNRKECGVTSYGIPFESIQLISRDSLPSSKFLFIKALEYYLRVRKQLKDYDYIWAHEIYTFIFPLLSKKNLYIWDQHEIPDRFQHPLLRRVFHIIEKKCLFMIHANEFRRDYLEQEGLIQEITKHKVIRNYPDISFSNTTTLSDQKGFNEFQYWLNGEDYVYLQGLSTNRRYPFNTVESILQETDLKVIIIGGFEEEAKRALLNKYGEHLYERVYFRGMVDQLDIPMYLKSAKFSIVLYDTLTANNRLCEPNRMYQAIILGVPVIVGCNEPMKELVDKYQFGISLNHDGKDLNNIRIKVRELNDKIEDFQKHIDENKNQIVWENQESKLVELIS